MGVGAIGPVSVLSSVPAPAVGNAGPANATGNSFASMLSNAIGQASDLSNQADAMAASYASGGSVSLDQLMMTEQQASLALDLVVQVRNRVVNAYQSIMNMQI